MSHIAFYSNVPPLDCPASAITWQCGATDSRVCYDDRKWQHEIYQQLPKRFSVRIATIYKSIFDQKGRFAANSYIREIEKLLNQIDFSIAGNEDEITRCAKENAESCRIYSTHHQFKRNRVSLLKEIVESKGINFPKHSETGIVNRLCDFNWWKRKLRKKHNRSLEKAALKLNLVNKRCSIYISNENLNSFRQQKARNQSLLQLMIATNELGEEFTLEQLSELSVSNPNVQRSELMVRIAGFEMYAKEKGYVGMFYTITCPSRMHCCLSKWCKTNPRYDGTTPTNAQSYLRQLWECIRSKLNRNNLEICGVRVAEPHHDGTPHWHLLVFMRTADEKAITEIFRSYALKDSPEERGAKKRRFTAKLIDSNRSATGYIAKYISKNIDGRGIQEDEYGNEAGSSSERVRAWASTHCIRQFQFFGGPPVSIWRELRRLNTCGLPENKIKEAAIFAQNNDWFGYMLIMDGIGCGRSGLPIELLKVWSDQEGKYGEPLGNIVRGLEFEGVSYISRIHTWVIKRKIESSCYSKWGGRDTVSELKLRHPAELERQGRLPLGFISITVRSG